MGTSRREDADWFDIRKDAVCKRWNHDNLRTGFFGLEGGTGTPLRTEQILQSPAMKGYVFRSLQTSTARRIGFGWRIRVHKRTMQFLDDSDLVPVEGR